MKTLHTRIHLYADADDSYVFTPINDGLESQSLTIHRSSGEIVLDSPNNFRTTYARRSPRVIYGIVGIISLTLSEYVVVLTGRELCGRLMGHEIYRATEFDILPLNPNVSVSHPSHPVEAHLLALVRSHLDGGNFIFAYGWDVTRRLQAQWESRDEAAHKHLWEMADSRFFWNRFLQSRFIEATASNTRQDFGRFILPMMYGTFDLRPITVQGRRLQLCLISRRSRFRAGTRYFRRGIDHDGHVANFNETEQLLLVEHTEGNPQPVSDDSLSAKLSFVQIRGSVPVFWGEISTLRYKPDLQIMDLQETVWKADVMRKHFQELVSIYGDQALVNLVNQKGYEKPVKDAYERYFAELKLPNIRYQYFDFHNECKNMRWDRISVLIDKLEDELERQGYFELDANDPEPVQLQLGIVRTNCMDNLDRTNVVQASLAKWTLNQQLRKLGIMSPGTTIDDFEIFSKEFRTMWADHADAIATAYGGSGALKSDFTRINKRTRMGLLEDGVKSTLRYLKNNYFDGPRQDAFDLFTGTWIPRKNPSTAMFLVTDSRPLTIRSAPAIVSFSLFMIVAGLTLPRSSDYSLFYYFMLWFILLAFALIFIIIHGIDYVSWPRLLPLTDVIFYSGPGHRSGDHGKGLKGTKYQMGLWQGGAKLLGNGRGPIETELVDVKQRVD